MNKFKTILTAGFIAGLLDIGAAIIVYAYLLNLTTPERLLQSVAAGIYGKDAFSGGWQTAITGLLLHFFIAMCFAVCFYLIQPGFKKIFGNKILHGIVYGIIVWTIMNKIVLPISAAKTSAFQWKYFLIGISIIIVCVGIPIAWIINSGRSIGNRQLTTGHQQ
jgi:uncharacterized membrane protein YagU involved in acid resistance